MIVDWAFDWEFDWEFDRGSKVARSLRYLIATRRNSANVKVAPKLRNIRV